MGSEKSKNIPWHNKMCFELDYNKNPHFVYTIAFTSNSFFFGDRVNDVLRRDNKPHSAYIDYCFKVLQC